MLAEAEQRSAERTEFSYNPEGHEKFMENMARALAPPMAVKRGVQTVEELRAQMAAKAAERRSRRA